MGATWHRGHVAEPRVARAVRRWCTGRGHAAGGHAVHAVHHGARVWCHVAVRLAYGGPTGIVGPWLGSGGGNTNALPHPTI